MKSALIIGITGQDGAYLAKLLVDKGYRVAGTSRDAQMAHREGLEALGEIVHPVSGFRDRTLDRKTFFRMYWGSPWERLSGRLKKVHRLVLGRS